MSGKTTTLNNGATLPLIALGTWQAAPGVVQKAIKEAIKAGYRHIDCARFYFNEPEIGEALQECINEGLVKREELFITTKLWCNAHRPEDVMPEIKKSLADLKLDYVDMYLIHWPVAYKNGVEWPPKADDWEDVPISDTWAAMEELITEGLTKGIGVSNFNVQRIEELLKTAKVVPAINQIEVHPYLQQPDLLSFCKEKGIHVTGYSPLGSLNRPDWMKQENEPRLLDNETIVMIAEKYQVTPGQVLLKYTLQTGSSVAAKSENPKRLRENLECTNVNLDEEDLVQIKKLDKQHRYYDGSFFCNDGSPWTLEKIWGQ